ncbi:hypothetical protein L218DRAFT_944303 [Marasmius fiardii PR-910]|nr:hypothetical protein L218DRAFT_944303 [Marasmius fiardii PR-910]
MAKIRPKTSHDTLQPNYRRISEHIQKSLKEAPGLFLRFPKLGQERSEAEFPLEFKTHRACRVQSGRNLGYAGCYLPEDTEVRIFRASINQFGKPGGRILRMLIKIAEEYSKTTIRMDKRGKNTLAFTETDSRDNGTRGIGDGGKYNLEKQGSRIRTLRLGPPVHLRPGTCICKKRNARLTFSPGYNKTHIEPIIEKYTEIQRLRLMIAWVRAKNVTVDIVHDQYRYHRDFEGYEQGPTDDGSATKNTQHPDDLVPGVHDYKEKFFQYLCSFVGVQPMQIKHRLCKFYAVVIDFCEKFNKPRTN